MITQRKFLILTTLIMIWSGPRLQTLIDTFFSRPPIKLMVRFVLKFIFNRYSLYDIWYMIYDRLYHIGENLQKWTRVFSTRRESYSSLGRVGKKENRVVAQRSLLNVFACGQVSSPRLYRLKIKKVIKNFNRKFQVIELLNFWFKTGTRESWITIQRLGVSWTIFYFNLSRVN